jgi:hypothetical protein
VYALVANTAFTDNTGFVVGRDAVLVVDSQFNGEMGRQVPHAVRHVTDSRISANANARLMTWCPSVAGLRAGERATDAAGGIVVVHSIDGRPVSIDRANYRGRVERWRS